MNGLMFIVLSGVTLALFSLPAQRIAGYRAEEIVVSRLSKNLPDDYVLFNQIEVPNARSRTGHTEVDILVVGPSGVHTLEVKSNNGEIMCRNDRSPTWRVKKTGRNGGTYYGSMRNPVRQAMSQALALRDYLSSNGIQVWVSPMIVATNKHSRWRNVERLDMPVVSGTSDMLIKRITTVGEQPSVESDVVREIETLLLSVTDSPRSIDMPDGNPPKN